MRPAARYEAAIGLLDQVLLGALADRALTDWGRASRYAGSKDRAAVADLVYDALRRRRSLAHRPGADTGRGLALALAAERGELDLFTGEGHAPAPPSPAERAALARTVPMPEPVALDYPDWLGPELERSLGPARAAIMAALRDRAPLDLRVNLLRTTREAARAALADEGITAEPLAAEPAALRVQAGATRLRSSAPYQDGRVEIQDLASQRVARFADARPGETALDYCAGGGGKTLALAMHMEGQGRLLAHDAAPPRMEELRRRAARAGLEVEIIGSEPATAPLACDLVLVDAPCSGSGAWRRQPDAKWRLTPAELARLQALQDQILALACRHVRPGGRLVYATCSLFEAENGDRVAAFLAARPDFRREAELRLTPLEGGDGFYACRLRPG